MNSTKSLFFISFLSLCFTSQVSANTAVVLRDSIGVETKDGKVYILHKVVSGETLYSISKKYSTTPDILKQLNPELTAGLKLGQVIRVPSKIKATSAPATNGDKSKVTFKSHTVASGETLYSISRLYNVSVDDIKKNNPEITGSISPGQVLKIPVAAGQATAVPATPAPAVPATPAPAAPATTTVKYTVKSGETLYSIATAYKITVDQLKQYNPGISTSLSAGQVINVPFKGNSSAPVAPAVENADPTTQLTDNTVVTPAPAAPAPTTPVTPPAAPAPSNVPPAAPAPGEKQNLPSSSVPKPNADYKKVNENGLALLSTDNNTTRFFYAWHKTAPVGTIIQVTNEQTGQWIFVKVIGKLPDNSGEKVIIRMTKKAWERLGATDDKISVSLSYLL